jgi:alkylated DNA repair protein (DNA oxidative demethylase)
MRNTNIECHLDVKNRRLSTVGSIVSGTCMTDDLFGFDNAAFVSHEQLGEQAVVMRAFAEPYVAALITLLPEITTAAPFRHMHTPGGYKMSVSMSNCGALGGIVDQHGYRYTDIDPLTNQLWPPMPQAMTELAQAAATAAGFADFNPQSCLINRYLPDAKMSLHQDKSEDNLVAPIVSVSLGMPAMFLFGGDERSDRPQRIPLLHGDVVVWGGIDRLRFHGVMPVQSNPHPLFGEQRINLTFRQVT